MAPLFCYLSVEGDFIAHVGTVSPKYRVNDFAALIKLAAYRGGIKHG